MHSSRGWIDEVVQLLAGADLKSVQVERAMTLKHRNLPRRIYKYRSNNDNSRDNLRNNTVWLSSPYSFNDPYDSSIKVSYDPIVSDAIRSLLEEFIAKHRLFEHLSAEDLEAVKRAPKPQVKLAELIVEKVEPAAAGRGPDLLGFIRSIDEWYISAMESRVTDFHKDSLKVCSFSKVNDSIIMWSHYGEQHRGFCIEYDLSDLGPSDLNARLLFPVVYSKAIFDATEYFRKAIGDRSLSNVLFPLLAALHKSPEWKYEREWRLVIIAGMVRQESNWQMAPTKRIYLGAKMEPKRRDELVEISNARKIEVRQMRVRKDSFTLYSEPVG
jgi:hypothetical protein